MSVKICYWVCSYCNKKFDVEKDVQKHEKDCRVEQEFIEEEDRRQREKIPSFEMKVSEVERERDPRSEANGGRQK